MSDNSSDDRFSMPPIEGVGKGRDEDAPEEPGESEAQPRRESEPLVLPPPGLFARLETPAADDLDDQDDDPIQLVPADHAEPDADDEGDETAVLDLRGETDTAIDDAEGEDDAPRGVEDAPAPLAGVVEAVDIVEQLAAQAAEPDEELAPTGDDLVYAEAAEAIALDAAEREEEAELAASFADEPPALPSYALVDDADNSDELVDDEVPARTAALPLYGSEPTGTDDEEILPHFLLEEAAPLDVVGAQEQLREIAQKNRRRSENEEHKPSLARTLAEIPILLIVAAVIAFLVKTFIAQAYYIPSGSMLPQLAIDDRVVVSKLAYKLHDPRRGDIVVFDDPREGTASEDATVERTGVSKLLRQVGEGVGVVQPSTDEFIKRVIALPGETVAGKNGFVYVNDRKLIEPYLPNGLETSDFPAQTVAEGKLWVMGDNRSGSADSRVFGQIEVDTIVGRAVVRVWPFSHISFL